MGGSEIILRPNQFCNLSEVIIRADDTEESLAKKVRIAAILGTFQSTLTGFEYLRDIWKENTDEERLLGVSMTGIMDNALTNGNGTSKKELKELLTRLRNVAIETNKEFAEILGIQKATSITCVKPSGCRPADALTTTTAGILTLEELFDSHQHGSAWGDYKGPARAIQGEDTATITKTFVNGEAPVLEITLDYGLSVRSTGNHKWYAPNHGDYVRADQIKVGDRLEIVSNLYKNSKAYEFDTFYPESIHMCSSVTEIKQPAYMTEDIAWLLGYLWGDGAMSQGKYRIRFTDAETANIEKAKRIVEEVFGVTAVIKQKPKEKALMLDFASKFLWHWLIKNGVWKYFTDEHAIDIIPRCVRSSKPEHIIAFMSGMIDADGWVGEAKGASQNVFKVTFTTSSANFSRHFQDVAWSVGLGFGRSKNTGGNNLQQAKEMYLMGLGKHTDKESFAVLLRNSEKMKGRNVNNLPWQPITDTKASPSIGVVKSVEMVGVMSTYDIETDNHWFYAGAVKSHNTVSQLTNSASGIHARHSPYYIRTVRGDVKDPLTKFMQEAGIPNDPCFMRPDSTVVFSFPQKAPEGAVTRNDMDALEQLELWLIYSRYWCEHKPSVTISVRESEWMAVGAWCWDHFDDLSGISFLPHSDHSYVQAPYQECSREEYEAALAKMPKSVKWDDLSFYEQTDNTSGSQTLACSGGACEVVDLN